MPSLSGVVNCVTGHRPAFHHQGSVGKVRGHGKVAACRRGAPDMHYNSRKRGDDERAAAGDCSRDGHVARWRGISLLTIRRSSRRGFNRASRTWFISEDNCFCQVSAAHTLPEGTICTATMTAKAFQKRIRRFRIEECKRARCSFARDRSCVVPAAMDCVAVSCASNKK